MSLVLRSSIESVSAFLQSLEQTSSGSKDVSLDSLVGMKMDTTTISTPLESTRVTKIDTHPTDASSKEKPREPYKTSKTTWEKTGNPKKAQIIFLGDIHTEMHQNKERGDLMDKYGGKGKVKDIVLCEGERACDLVEQSSCRFTSQRKYDCYGWDDIESVDESLKSISDIYALKDKYKEDKPSSQWSAIDIRKWDNSWEKYYLHLDRRTESLIKTVNVALEDLQPKQKIFVIAGSDHLVEERNGFNVLDHFKKYKTAMLIPDDSVIKGSDDREYFETLRS